MCARTSRRCVAAAIALALLGCNPELVYGDGDLVRCDADADCIAGFVCVGLPARCVSPETLDRTGAALVAPALDAVVSDGRVALAWRGVPGAASYVVEVSTDPAGAQPIVGSPFLVEGGLQTLVLDDLDRELTHYWRVRADISAPDVVPETWRFDVIGAALHVFCPAERTSCVPGGGEVQAGNLSRPFTRIQDAVEAAERLQRGAIKVAGRGASAAYDESLAISRGLVLSGGYDPSFSERNATSYEVWVRHPVSAIAVSLTEAPTVIEGIRFSAGAATTPITATVTIENARSSVTLRDCQVTADEAESLSLAVRVSSSLLDGGVTLEDVVVGAANALVVRGVSVRESSVRVIDTQITATGQVADDVAGIEVTSAFSSLLVSGSTIEVAGLEVATGISSSGAATTVTNNAVEVGFAQNPAPRFSNGIILGDEVENASVTNNRVSVRGGRLSRGVLKEFLGSALIANNLVGAFGCPSNDSQGMLLRFYESESLFAVHNTVVVTPGGESTHAFALENGPVGNGIVRNNVAARVDSCVSPVLGFTSLLSLGEWIVIDNLVSAELPLGVALSNTTLAQAGADVFVSVAGADGLTWTLADNDWRLGPLAAGYAGSAPALVSDCATVMGSAFAGPTGCDLLAFDAVGVARLTVAVTPGALEGP